MAQQRKTAKKEAIAKAAAMFEVTSMTDKQLSAAAKMVEGKSGNPLDNIIENTEIEKMHAEEIAEAKALGLETDPIIEATNSEIVSGLEKQVDEAQRRYLEAIEDKKASEARSEQLSKENDALKKTIMALSSEYDCYKIDASREIDSYKVDICDLREKVAMYEQNESNYKFEMTKLRAEIANLEGALERSSAAKKPSEQRCGSGAAGSIPMFSSNPRMKRPSQSNGYSSWN